MTQHTPGPWSLCSAPASDPYTARNVVADNGETVATIASGYHHEQPFTLSQDEARANARLIAAAPDLIAALSAIRAACTRIEDDEEIDAAKALADAAIAKAEGKP